MASTSINTDVRVAHVSFSPDTSHLTLQLCLLDDRKVFFCPISEKLDRLRYRLQLLASNVSIQKKKRKNGAKDGKAPTVSVKFYDIYNQEMNDKTLKVGDALMRAKRLEIGEEIFVVLHNQPIVTGLKVLEPVMAGIVVYPLLETRFCTAEECSWQWFRLDKEDETSKTLMVTERRYIPTEAEIGYRFCVKCQAPTIKSSLHKIAILKQ